mgnify:CR=1 FL=1
MNLKFCSSLGRLFAKLNLNEFLSNLKVVEHKKLFKVDQLTKLEQILIKPFKLIEGEEKSNSHFQTSKIGYRADTMHTR